MYIYVYINSYIHIYVCVYMYIKVDGAKYVRFTEAGQTAIFILFNLCGRRNFIIISFIFISMP